jgi:hypothetical protein
MIALRWQTTGNRIPTYEFSTPAEALTHLGEALHDDLHARLQEAELAVIEQTVRKAQETLPDSAPFRRINDGDFLLARLCYLVTRAVCPSTVIETGVCYGVTSAFVLQALQTNGKGYLHSIDLPPLGKNGDKFVGRFVPSDLRKRWVLHRGTSTSHLSPLLQKVGPPGVFIHDSLHTYANMRYEFDTIWPSLEPYGVVISDDIQGNAAFLELTAQESVARSVVMQEERKDSLFGVVAKGAPCP